MNDQEIEEDVDQFLLKMEEKYSPHKYKGNQGKLHSQIARLSEELDTLGIPGIDLRQPLPKLTQQLIDHTHLLIQIHRTTLRQITDINIEKWQTDSQNRNLENTIAGLNRQLKTLTGKNTELTNKLLKVNGECTDFKAAISRHSEETERVKRYFKTKHNELIHSANNLKNENHRLKELCGKSADKYMLKDDKLVEILGQHRRNEAIYKDTIKKLENNNAEIMNEVVSLKEELALAYITEK